MEYDDTICVTMPRPASLLASTLKHNASYMHEDA